VEATLPTYTVGVDNCAADYSNCPAPTDPSYPFTPGVFKPYDDGVTVVEADRLASWWRPYTLALSVDGGAPVNAHYVVLYQKIQDSSEVPQFLVLYEDGYLRLIPQPPVGSASVCFGASVLIGPAAPADRPYADIASIGYLSPTHTLTIAYRSGGSASISVLQVSRGTARVAVAVNYAVDTSPFATFRSMFVAAGNADTDAVRWTGLDGAVHDDSIMQFAGGAGTDWFFYRRTRSVHNTSAPNIEVAMSASASQ
jgi:hypothetical protein